MRYRFAAEILCEGPGPEGSGCEERAPVHVTQTLVGAAGGMTEMSRPEGWSMRLRSPRSPLIETRYEDLSPPQQAELSALRAGMKVREALCPACTARVAAGAPPPPLPD